MLLLSHPKILATCLHGVKALRRSTLGIVHVHASLWLSVFVLFALWNFSILARVVPAEVHQRKVDTVMLDSYLAEAESTANSETVTSDIASVVASSAAPTLSSKAYNNIEHTKRVEKEPRSESVSLSLVDNHRQ
jgi:hypothetical protein